MPASIRPHPHQPLTITGAASGATTTYSYDGQNRVSTVTDSEGYTTTYYDIKMTLNEAIEVLKKGRIIGEEEKKAIKVIEEEIVATTNAPLIFATLVARLKRSTNPAFSYRILWCILEGG